MTWPAFKEENDAASRREISESLYETRVIVSATCWMAGIFDRSLYDTWICANPILCIHLLPSHADWKISAFFGGWFETASF